MADITITAANVILSTGTTAESKPVLVRKIAGTTIAAGQILCRNTTTGKMELADANGAEAYHKVAAGIAVHGALADQPIEYIESGDIAVGAVLTAGTYYVLSATAGVLCLLSDLSSGRGVSYIGYATTTSNLRVKVANTGVTL